MPEFMRDNWKRLTVSGAAVLVMVGWFVRRLRPESSSNSDSIPVTEPLPQPDSDSATLSAAIPDNETLSAQPDTPETTRRFTGRLFGALAVILMLCSGEAFHWQPGDAPIPALDGVHFMLAGALALAVSVWLVRPAGVGFQTARDPIQAIPVRWRYVGAGTVLLLLMAEASGRGLIKNFAVSQHLQALLFVAGVALVAYGFGGLTRIRVQNLFRRSTLLLWFIVGVGFLIRIWQLEESVRFLIDESHFMDGVLHLWNDPSMPLLAHVDNIASFPHFFSYVERWTSAVFGNNLFGIRFASVIFGTLNIVAVYYLGCAVGSRRTGLTAAALLALFAPHLHFSRLALNNIADPLFGTLALAFLVRAMRYNRQSDYVLAGVFLGMAGYFYEGGRLLFTAVCAAWLILMLIFRRPPAVRRGVVMFGIVAALVLMPYYYFALSQRIGITLRLTSGVRLEFMLRDLQEEPAGLVLATHYETSLRPAILHVIYAPDGSLFYYGGETGILPWYVVPWFFMGLFYALLWMRSTGIMLWLWLGFGVVGISLVVSTDWTARFVALFPAMVMAVTLGLDYLLDVVAPPMSARGRNAFLMVLVASLGLLQVSYYFEEHLKVYNVQIRRGAHDFQDAYDRASRIPFVSRVIYVTDDYIFPPLLFVTRHYRGITTDYEIWTLEEGFEEKINALAAGENNGLYYAFAVNPGDVKTLSAIRKVFPLTPAPWSMFDSVPIERQYLLYVAMP